MKKEFEAYYIKAIKILETLAQQEELAARKIARELEQMIASGAELSSPHVLELNDLCSSVFIHHEKTRAKGRELDLKYFGGEIGDYGEVLPEGE